MSILRPRSAILTALLGCALSAQVAAAPAPVVSPQTEGAAASLQLEDLTTPPDFWGAQLAPDGHYVAGIRRNGRQHVLVTIDLDSAELDAVPQTIGKYSISWIRWANNDQLIVYLGVADRIAAVGRDGVSLQWLLDSGSAYGSRKFHNPRLVSALPGDPEHILMSAWHDGGRSLFKVSISTGGEERVAAGNERTKYWFVDRAGNPAFRIDTNSNGSVWYVYARQSKSGNGEIRWRKTHTLRRDPSIPGRIAFEKFRPLSPGPTVTSYYVTARPEHANTVGIYLYDFEAGKYLETIYSNASFDVTRAIFDPDTGEPLGFFYYADKAVFEMRDRTIQACLSVLEERFGSASIYPLQASTDRTRLLLLARGPQDAGSYHVYDATTRASHPIANMHDNIARRALAPAEVVKYEARDGLALTGYLTRPVGAGARDTPPLLVLPHGGPERRDTLTFHPLSQLFAASGYQVFQPNFRGSSGYGRRFVDLGHGQFGRAMQTDIDDGVAHLVNQGLADPDRACIIGTSYGGYAALAAATLTPDMYQCVISQAGISDLVRQLKAVRTSQGGDSEAFKYWVEYIGHPKTDRVRLEAVSPAYLADRVTAPVLLFHGQYDNIVPIEQSKIMERKLREAGKEVEFIPTPTGHQVIDHSSQPEVFAKIMVFLQEHLPVD